MLALTHLRLRRHLAAYVDGELSAAPLAAVVRHVDECLDCSGAVQLQRLVRSSLRRRPDHDPVPLALARLSRLAHQLALIHPRT